MDIMINGRFLKNFEKAKALKALGYILIWDVWIGARFMKIILNNATAYHTAYCGFKGYWISPLSKIDLRTVIK